MRIGVDFDGVLSNMSEQKIKYAQQFWGIRLTPAMCTTSIAKDIVTQIIPGFGNGFISKQRWDGKAEYTHLVRLLEAGPAILNGYPEPDAAKCLGELISEGHKIIIITTLEPENNKWAEAFLNKYNIPYTHLVCVPYKKGNPEEKDQKYTKKVVMSTLKMDVLIDDTYQNLEPLTGFKILLFLFTQPWNKDIKISKQDIIRVFGWTDVANKIRASVSEKVLQ